MKNVSIAFELYEVNVKDCPPEYQEVSCHIIFDINMGDNFRRKYQMAAVGHKTTSLSYLTDSSVVSWYSVRIAITISFVIHVYIT